MKDLKLLWEQGLVRLWRKCACCSRTDNLKAGLDGRPYCPRCFEEMSARVARIINQ